MGAMLSRILCRTLRLARSPRKHANLAGFACFRGDLVLVHRLQTIRESMAPHGTSRHPMANLAGFACFRGDLVLVHRLQTIRESMAPMAPHGTSWHRTVRNPVNS